MSRIRPRLWNRTDPDRPKSCRSIMRPHYLSNPYTIGVDGSRAIVIAKFETDVRNNPRMLKEIELLDDVDLVCCCSPMPCHGDVILKIWDERNNSVSANTD